MREKERERERISERFIHRRCHKPISKQYFDVIERSIELNVEWKEEVLKPVS